MSKGPAFHPAAQSLHVMARGAFKLAIFLAAASLYAVAGQGFVKHLASLTLLSGLCCVMLGQIRREQLSAPHYTHFDEAAWFLMLSTVVRGYA